MTTVVRETRRAGASGLQRYELDEWPQPGSPIRAGLAGGQGSPDFRVTPGTPPRDAWAALQADLGGIARVRASHQVHGSTVHWHPGGVTGARLAADGDGHATGDRGVLLLVTVADCVPIYLAGRQGEGVALLHGGWRGVADGILAAGVHLLRERAGLAPQDIAIHCGISICGSCYTVGSDVQAALGSPRGAPSVDLRAVLSRQAADLGIGQISVSPWCAAHDRAHFLSHRASRGADGRMAAYIVIGGDGS